MKMFEETLRDIEKLEKEWKYTLSEEENVRHSFGRVPEDGKDIALWSVPRSTGNFLTFITEALGAKTILELGCSAGYSTLFLAKAVQNTGGHIFTTEILKEKINLAKKHFSKAEVESQITLIEKDILLVLQEWKNKPLDLVFMDADKERYSTYLNLLLPLLSPKGIIIVDNAGKVRMSNGDLIDSEHILKFRKEVAKNTSLNTSFLEVDNGLLLISKKKQ
jgi:caffeoyl-CoA O-methyltransferase